MKVRVIKTGEIVNVTPYPTWYKEDGQGPNRREWDEDELEFIPNPNITKMVPLNKVCEFLKTLTYQEYSGGPLVYKIDNNDLEKLRKEFE